MKWCPHTRVLSLDTEELFHMDPSADSVFQLFFPHFTWSSYNDSLTIDTSPLRNKGNFVTDLINNVWQKCHCMTSDGQSQWEMLLLSGFLFLWMLNFQTSQWVVRESKLAHTKRSHGETHMERNQDSKSVVRINHQTCEWAMTCFQPPA